MGPMVLSLLGAVGSVFGSFFNMKSAGYGTVSQGLSTVGEIAQADASSDMARSLAIVAEASSGSFLAANWRPLMMLNFLLLIDLYWFGYRPPHMSHEDFVMIFAMIKIGLCGYGCQRTVEKVVDKVNVGRLLGAVMGKKYNKVVNPDDTGKDDSNESIGGSGD